MTGPEMSTEYAVALRTALVSRAAPDPKRRRRKWMLGASIAVAGLFAGTAAAAATGILRLPGSTTVTPLATTVTGSFAGTDSVQLGAPPASATGIVIALRCLTPGALTLPGGAGLTCSPDDFLQAGPAPGFDGYLIALSEAPAGQLTVTASTSASRWSLSAAYATSETSKWARNSSGQSYGVINENGSPELIAVLASNGTSGYVHRADLEAATGVTAALAFDSPQDAVEWQRRNAGSTHSIPVFESDGTSRIGTFDVVAPR